MRDRYPYGRRPLAGSGRRRRLGPGLARGHALNRTRHRRQGRPNARHPGVDHRIGDPGLGIPPPAVGGARRGAGIGRVARMPEEAATDRSDAAAGDRPARSLRTAYRRLHRVKDARPAQPDALAVLDPVAAAIRDPMLVAGQGRTRPKGRFRPKTAPIRRDPLAERRGEWPETAFAAGTGRRGHSPRPANGPSPLTGRFRRRRRPSRPSVGGGGRTGRCGGRPPPLGRC